MENFRSSSLRLLCYRSHWNGELYLEHISICYVRFTTYVWNVQKFFTSIILFFHLTVVPSALLTVYGTWTAEILLFFLDGPLAILIVRVAHKFNFGNWSNNATPIIFAWSKTANVFMFFHGNNNIVLFHVFNIYLSRFSRNNNNARVIKVYMYLSMSIF